MSIERVEKCFCTPPLLVFLIFLLWGSMCCLIYINRNQKVTKKDSKKKRDIRKDSEKEKSKVEPKAKEVESKSKEVESKAVEVESKAAEVDVGGGSNDMDNFINGLETKMDRIETNLIHCRNLVVSNPPGQNKPYHSLYYDMYQDLRKMVDNPSPNTDGSPGTAPPVNIVDFKPTKSLAKNTTQFADSLSGLKVMLNSTREAASAM